MDIYAKRGTKVTPFYVNGKAMRGYDSDARNVEMHLQEGEWYTVLKTDVGNWSTRVYLEEIVGTSFNSVCLCDEEDLKPEPAAVPTAISVGPEMTIDQWVHVLLETLKGEGLEQLMYVLDGQPSKDADWANEYFQINRDDVKLGLYIHYIDNRLFFNDKREYIGNLQNGRFNPIN